MRVTPLLLAALPATSHALYNFSPENSSSLYDTDLPAQYSLPESQLASLGTNSYWYTHFLTTTNKTQYVLISHALVLPNNQATVRTSLLDANNPEVYWKSARTVPLERNSTSDGGQLSIKTPGFEISSSTEDNLAAVVSAGSTEQYEYNLTVHATSKVILNAGTGFFKWGAANTTQWSLPSCQTTGTLSIGNISYEIDGEQSLSWYDRQYGVGTADRGFTWFGVQFPGSDVKASVWFSDNENPEQHLRFGTVRTSFGLTIVRFSLIAYEEEAWTSPQSNVTYQTKWLLEFDNGDYLHVQSVRKEQEIYSDDFVFASAFAIAEGKFFGQEIGFAMIDIVPPATA